MLYMYGSFLSLQCDLGLASPRPRRRRRRRSRDQSFAMATAMAMAVLVFLVLALSAANSDAVALVTGTVYCDRCLEGHRTLWGTPLRGASVALECQNSSALVAGQKKVETDLLGMYAIRLEGSPDMQGRCVARLVSGPKDGSGCNLTGVASRPLKLTWKLFGLSYYTSDAMSCKPRKPMSSCPSSSSPPSPVSLPPMPFGNQTACDPRYWLDPQYQCYWRLISPNSTVAVWFGPAAGNKYGTQLTLREGLQGSGEVYRVLLRESIAASLNSFNSIKFFYNPISVTTHLNEALVGTPKDAFRWALAFRRANLGNGGKVPCLMKPCA